MSQASKVFIEHIMRGEGLMANSVLVLLFGMQEEIGHVIDSLQSVVITIIVVLLLRISMMFRGFKKGR